MNADEIRTTVSVLIGVDSGYVCDIVASDECLCVCV